MMVMHTLKYIKALCESMYSGIIYRMNNEQQN
ncbi:MAG: hypothetical protein K0R50_4362 [Eubacterium sp.]|nr:hypothetical protein [Eubacterium sp.]